VLGYGSTESYSDPSARYNSDVGQSDCMSAQQNGNDVARGEQNPQQRSQIIEKTKAPIVEIIINNSGCLKR
jgi:hypothetical protein